MNKHREKYRNYKYNTHHMYLQTEKVLLWILWLNEWKLKFVLSHGGEENEDLMFFRTLLSHVNKILNRKLAFRCHIQGVVEQFAYGLYKSIESLKAFLNTLLETVGLMSIFKLFQSCAPFTLITLAAEQHTVQSTFNSLNNNVQ